MPKLHEYLKMRYDEKMVDLEAVTQNNKTVVGVYSNKKEPNSKPLITLDCTAWVEKTNKPNVFKVTDERSFMDALKKVQGSPFVTAKEVVKKDSNKPILIINGIVEIDYSNGVITIFNN